MHQIQLTHLFLLTGCVLSAARFFIDTPRQNSKYPLSSSANRARTSPANRNFCNMRVISVHGFNASSDMNFHPWLADQLRDRGFQVETPDLDLSSDDDIDLKQTIADLKEQIGFLKKDDILVGHSLGAFIVLQYLEAVEMTETPRAVLLIAAPWHVQKEELQRLFVADLDADVLMWKAREFVVVHSKDDELVPFEHGEKMAKALKAKLVALEDCGHFMKEEYPILLETIQEIADTSFEYAPGEGLEDDFKSIRN